MNRLGDGARFTVQRPNGLWNRLAGWPKETRKAEKEETEKPHFLREKDLKGHMINDSEKAPETKKKDEETDTTVKILLEKDNQVRYSVQLLESWNIFSDIKTGQGQ